MNSYITFNINNQVMAIDMINVEKVIKLSKVFLVPNSADYLEGVLDFQKVMIPVINVKKRLNLKNCDVNSDSNVIVINNNDGKTGIIVDSVNDIITISEKDVTKQIGNKYVYGVVRIGEDIINLLNPESIIIDSNMS